MINETWENWEYNIKKTIELDPDCVTIYQMEIPYNTGILQAYEGRGKVTAPVADWQTKRDWVNYAFNELAKHGYEVGSAYTMVKSKQKQSLFTVIRFGLVQILWVLEFHPLVI